MFSFQRPDSYEKQHEKYRESSVRAGGIDSIQLPPKQFSPAGSKEPAVTLEEQPDHGVSAPHFTLPFKHKQARKAF